MRAQADFVISRGWSLWNLGGAFPTKGQWWNHLYRKWNSEADALAGNAADTGLNHWWCRPFAMKNGASIRVMFDGSHRSGRTAVGWVLQAANADDDVWTTVASAGHCIHKSSSIVAELVAAFEAMVATSNFIMRGVIDSNSQGAFVTVLGVFFTDSTCSDRCPLPLG